MRYAENLWRFSAEASCLTVPSNLKRAETEPRAEALPRIAQVLGAKAAEKK